MAAEDWLAWYSKWVVISSAHPEDVIWISENFPERVMNKLKIMLVFIVICQGCSTDRIDFDQLEDAEQAYIKRIGRPYLHKEFDEIYLAGNSRKLAKAVCDRNDELIQELVENGVDVNSSGEKGIPVSFCALRNNHLSSLHKLMALGVDPNVVFENTSLLHLASRLGNLDMLRALLDNGRNEIFYQAGK